MTQRVCQKEENEKKHHFYYNVLIKKLKLFYLFIICGIGLLIFLGCFITIDQQTLLEMIFSY